VIVLYHTPRGLSPLQPSCQPSRSPCDCGDPLSHGGDVRVDNRASLTLAGLGTLVACQLCDGLDNLRSGLASGLLFRSLDFLSIREANRRDAKLGCVSPREGDLFLPCVKAKDRIPKPYPDHSVHRPNLRLSVPLDDGQAVPRLHRSQESPHHVSAGAFLHLDAPVALNRVPTNVAHVVSVALRSPAPMLYHGSRGLSPLHTVCQGHGTLSGNRTLNPFRGYHIRLLIVNVLINIALIVARKNLRTKP